MLLLLLMHLLIMVDDGGRESPLGREAPVRLLNCLPYFHRIVAQKAQSSLQQLLLLARLAPA